MGFIRYFGFRLECMKHTTMIVSAASSTR